MDEGFQGGVTSPGGFVFGVQGWSWGEPRPRSITFFIDGSAMVCDQHGRPIKGAVVNTDGNAEPKEVKFATSPPISSEDGVPVPRMFASHRQTIAALEAERIDWQKLACAGWPQLPYEELKKLHRIPPTPRSELLKIRDPQLRKDALRMRKEADEAMEAGTSITDEEPQQTKAV